MGRSSAGQKPVKIKVNTTITNGSDKETFELTTFGRYYEKGDRFFLQYEEFLEEGTIKSVMKVSEKETLILRSGAINMRMVFQQDKILQGRYETPYGLIDLITHTKRISYSLEKDQTQGTIDILYDLNLQGAHAGTYYMEMKFEEEKR